MRRRDALKGIEDTLSLIHQNGPAPVFILGAPRSGSTFLYQGILANFESCYFTNLVNDAFPDFPLVGLALQKNYLEKIPHRARFGRAVGEFAPSEANAVFHNWFGNDHPTEKPFVLCHDERHFLRTIDSMGAMYSVHPVIKHAWNCFRIKYLKELFPRAFFVWIDRKVSDAAKSDLHARYITKRQPTIWNAATSADLEELKRRPYWEQVVLNQLRFREKAKQLPAGRSMMVSYERLRAHPGDTLAEIADRSFLKFRKAPLDLPVRSSTDWDLPPRDIEAIDNFCEELGV